MVWMVHFTSISRYNAITFLLILFALQKFSGFCDPPERRWKVRGEKLACRVWHCSWLIMSVCSLLAQGFSSPSNWSTLYAYRRAQILIHTLYDGQGSRWVGQGVIRSSLLPIWSLKPSPFIVHYCLYSKNNVRKMTLFISHAEMHRIRIWRNILMQFEIYRIEKNQSPFWIQIAIISYQS